MYGASPQKAQQIMSGPCQNKHCFLLMVEICLLPDIRKIVPDADSSVLGYYDMTSLSCVLVHDMKEERLQLTMRSVTCTPDPQDLVPNSFSSMR